MTGTMRLRRRARKPKQVRKVERAFMHFDDPSLAPKGCVCTTPLLHLKPTQPTVGYIQVETEARKLGAMRARKLRNKLLKKPIPVIVGPDRNAYVLDHHHLASALWTLGFDHVPIEVQEKAHKMTVAGFWAKMRKRKWLHVDDRKRLPRSISLLKNDPFQSVAWAAMQEGAYAKSKIAVSDFKWADYFREKLPPMKEGRSSFRKLVKRAVRLAHEREARKLPGFVPLPGSRALEKSRAPRVRRAS